MEPRARIYVPPILTMMVSLGGAVVVLAGMRAISSIIGGLLMAIVLAICLGPAQRSLVDRHWPRWLAFLTVTGGVLAVVIGLCLLMAVSFAQLTGTIPQYQDQIAQYQAEVQSALRSVGIDTDSSSATTDPSVVVNALVGVVEWLVSGISGFVVTLILFAYMLLDATGFGNRLALAVSPATYEHFSSTAGNLRRYFVLTGIVNGLVAIFNTVFLYQQGIAFAGLWGVLSFFLGFIPNIGFIIALVGPTIMALLQYGTTEAIYVIVAFTVINGLVSNIVQPKLIGTGLNLQPFIVMFSVLFWGFILGPIGAILAIPMTLATRFILESWPETERLARLIGRNLEVPGPPTPNAHSAPDADA